MSLTSLSGSCTGLQNIGKIGRKNGRFQRLALGALARGGSALEIDQQKFEGIFFQVLEIGMRSGEQLQMLASQEGPKISWQFCQFSRTSGGLTSHMCGGPTSRMREMNFTHE